MHLYDKILLEQPQKSRHVLFPRGVVRIRVGDHFSKWNGGEGDSRDEPWEWRQVWEVSGKTCGVLVERGIVFIDGGGHDNCTETRVDDVNKDGSFGLNEVSGKRDDNAVKIVPQ